MRSAGARALITASAACVGAVALVAYTLRGMDWLAGLMVVVATVGGLGGVAEVFLERVELAPDALILRSLRGTRRIPISDIAQVDAARGAAPAVRLRSGDWINLPDVGAAFGNAARAWLRAGGSESGRGNLATLAD